MFENLAEIIDINEDSESVKLLKASETIENALTIKPITSFIVNNITLQIIPSIPPKTPYFSLTV